MAKFGSLGFLGNVQMVESPGVPQYDTFGHQIGYTPGQITYVYDDPTPTTTPTITPTPITVSTPTPSDFSSVISQPQSIATLSNPTAAVNNISQLNQVQQPGTIQTKGLLESIFGLFAPTQAATSTTPVTTTTSTGILNDIETFYNNNKTIVWVSVGLVGAYLVFVKD